MNLSCSAQRLFLNGCMWAATKYLWSRSYNTCFATAHFWQQYMCMVWTQVLSKKESTSDMASRDEKCQSGSESTRERRD